MGFCFSFGSESLAIVFCRGSLGVTDCVRPGVATFFIITRLSVYWGDHMSVRMLSVVGIGELDKWRKRTAPRPGNR